MIFLNKNRMYALVLKEKKDEKKTKFFLRFRKKLTRGRCKY